MSEAELHLLKQRLYQGCLSKARRGALTFALPMGYVWDRDGAIQFDPDEQVQAVVRLIFAQFEELGALGGLLRYLARHDIRLGGRVREGPGKGQLVWRRPNRATLQNLLKHPLYAGAYVYGRRQIDRRRSQSDHPQSGRVVMSRSDWHALLPDRCPAYLSSRAVGAQCGAVGCQPEPGLNAEGCAPRGSAVSGLGGVRPVREPSWGALPALAWPFHPFTYDCVAQRNGYGKPLCQQVAGPCLDDFVTAHVLAALAPASLELSLATAEQVEQERAAVTQLWEQRRERATYETDRAARQYQAVEPENRLVARTLERVWEEKLQTQQALEEEYQRFLQQQPRMLTAEERAAIRQLATDIPARWNASTTTHTDRNDILRQVVERVEVEVQGKTEQVRVCSTWAGGGQTEGLLARPLARYTDRSDYAAVCARVQELTAAGWSLEAIAQQLAVDSYPPLRSKRGWSAVSVQTLRRQLGLGNTHRHGSSREALGPDEWWARELADRLGVSHNTRLYWIEHGTGSSTAWCARGKNGVDGSAGWGGPLLRRSNACGHIDTVTLPSNSAVAGRPYLLCPHCPLCRTTRKGQHHDRHKSTKRS
jgi:Recombinase